MPLSHSFDTSIYDMVKIDVADPAVATNFTFTIPDNTRLQLLFIQFTLTTDANVANRQAQLSFNLGAPLDLVISTKEIQTASTGRRILFANCFSFPFQADGSLQYYGPLPCDLWLNQGSTIASVIDNIQAGDQLSAITLYVKRQIAE